jgi:hypothetical protein
MADARSSKKRMGLLLIVLGLLLFVPAAIMLESGSPCPACILLLGVVLFLKSSSSVSRDSARSAPGPDFDGADARFKEPGYRDPE